MSAHKVTVIKERWNVLQGVRARYEDNYEVDPLLVIAPTATLAFLEVGCLSFEITLYWDLLCRLPPSTL